MAHPIGTVEILKDRVYPIGEGNQAYVKAGPYPVFQDGMVIFWMMEGNLLRTARTGATKIGDGMFAMGGPDDAMEVMVRFPSKFYGEEEFTKGFKSLPLCTEGNPEQRLRFTMDKR